MRIERRSGSDERRILIGMVTDPLVLGRITTKWRKEEEGLFGSKWANLVGSWCVKFHKRYGKAPGQAIESLFESWSVGKDKETITLIEKFLTGLSGEYEQNQKEANSQYILDLAGRHFNRIRLQRLTESIQADLDNGQAEQAQKRIVEFGGLELGTGSWVDVLRDQNALLDSFAERGESLVKYPGALGEFFGDQLQRDAFVAFMAPEKRGKSHTLMDLAWRGILQRRKVAFFEVGDMSQRQTLRRWYIRAARVPRKPKSVRYPKSLQMIDGRWMVEIEDRVFEKGIEPKDVKKALEKITTQRIKTKETLLRLSVHPNDSISVDGIRSVLQEWERDQWVPDIICIDYADILAPPSGSNTIDSRDQINLTWKKLRALSQSLHCLVVTATQSDAASYSATTMSRKHFSNDKRKLAHVTAMVGLNQTESEKADGVMRYNWIGVRDAEYTEGRCVAVAGCLDLCHPTVVSSWGMMDGVKDKEEKGSKE